MTDEKKEQSKKTRGDKIEEIRNKPKAKITESDKMILDREMKLRARENADAERDLKELLPSQMTKEEMEKYCKSNKIKIEETDSTVVIRQKIRAFRDPAMADRLATLN